VIARSTLFTPNFGIRDHDHELLKFNFDEGYKLALVWLLFKEEKF